MVSMSSTTRPAHRTRWSGAFPCRPRYMVCALCMVPPCTYPQRLSLRYVAPVVSMAQKYISYPYCTCPMKVYYYISPLATYLRSLRLQSEGASVLLRLRNVLPLPPRSAGRNCCSLVPTPTDAERVRGGHIDWSRPCPTRPDAAHMYPSYALASSSYNYYYY